MAELTVIIPTRRLDGRILKTAASIRSQEGLPAGAELIIVADGGGAEYETVEKLHLLFEKLTILEINKSGPGAARNAGLAKASGRVVFFTGDDIVFAPGAFRAHLLARKAHPGPCAVCGSTVPGSRAGRSSLSDFLSGVGPQFDPEKFSDGEQLSYGYFMTANLSVDSEIIADIGGFDSTYRHPALEDTDLGYRMKKKGYRIYYAKKAMAVHAHTPSLPEFAERERQRGEALRYFICKFPELADKEGIGGAVLKKYRILLSSGAVAKTAAAAARLERLYRLLPAPVSRRIYRSLLGYYLLKGYSYESSR